jgi:initiation factor 1A
MPNRGGKKTKRGKKFTDSKKAVTPLAEADQRYGIITKCLGDCQLLVTCSDTEVRRVTIPGKFKKKVWMNVADIILVQIDQFNDNHVLYKYDSSEARSLRVKGLINFDVTDDGETDNIFDEGCIADRGDDIYKQMDRADLEAKNAKKLLSNAPVADPKGETKPMTAKEKEKLARKVDKKDKDVARTFARDNKDYSERNNDYSERKNDDIDIDFI